MAGKQITNEAIISALLLHGKVKDAAEALKCSPRTISDRMRESDFRSDYLEARSGMIREAAVTINAKLGKAISTVEEIMLDADNNPADDHQQCRQVYRETHGSGNGGDLLQR